MARQSKRLTESHTRQLTSMLSFPIGLRSVHVDGRPRPVLLVKVPKEVVLTAKVRGGFKIYVVPVECSGRTTVGLVSAFFDDHDEPLTVTSPLLRDDGSEALRSGLLGGALDVHFFDELGHERLGYVGELAVPHATAATLRSASLLAPDDVLLREIWTQLPTFMCKRDAHDDANAISVHFRERLFDDSAELGEGGAHRPLVRPEPGPLQELDIIEHLQRALPDAQVFHGPLRVTDKEEIADVVLFTPTRILLVQAKDSPNTETIVNNTLARKKATALKSLQKAAGQAAGAVRYVHASPTPRMLVDGRQIALPTHGRQLFSLLVLKELFSDEFDEYSSVLLELHRRTKTPCVALDYPELTMYSSHLAGEVAFFGALERVFSFGTEHGSFPRLRLRPPEA